MSPSLTRARGPALALALAPCVLTAAAQLPVARVEGPDGPVAGARITLVAEDGRVASAETDSRGRARLPEIADADRVLVAAEGYVPVELAFDDARRAGFSFRLARGRAVELRVTAAGTG
ncbi:MAG: carboxypeptidase regulatory-like domain-containing protein, partial [Acidobacteria bacterium]